MLHGTASPVPGCPNRFDGQRLSDLFGSCFVVTRWTLLDVDKSFDVGARRPSSLGVGFRGPARSRKGRPGDVTPLKKSSHFERLVTSLQITNHCGSPHQDASDVAGVSQIALPSNSSNYLRLSTNIEVIKADPTTPG
jgi:hypothetical protein